MDTTHRSHADEPHTDARAALGQRGEELAAAALRERGLTILDRNWRVRTGPVRGELDLICRDGDTLVIVEVKTRRTSRFGGPLPAVTREKRSRIRALATAWLHQHPVRSAAVRFDVVGVTIGADGQAAIDHVAGAF